MTRKPQIKNNNVLKTKAVSSGELDADALLTERTDKIDKNIKMEKFLVLFLNIFKTS
jgi:hypothetical protein|tara:strand:- start:518 stop:688 length:171 start_codon:yes stop_codon:yes gene_type:complete